LVTDFFTVRIGYTQEVLKIVFFLTRSQYATWAKFQKLKYFKVFISSLEVNQEVFEFSFGAHSKFGHSGLVSKRMEEH
jgi:hypothetical protein